MHLVCWSGVWPATLDDVSEQPSQLLKLPYCWTDDCSFAHRLGGGAHKQFYEFYMERNEILMAFPVLVAMKRFADLLICQMRMNIL